MSAYVATKFALEGLSESLDDEVRPFGIKVTPIEPGVVKTKIFRNSVVGQAALREDSPYFGMLGILNSHSVACRKTLPYRIRLREIIEAISSPEPKLRYPVGEDVISWLETKSTMTIAAPIVHEEFDGESCSYSRIIPAIR